MSKSLWFPVACQCLFHYGRKSSTLTQCRVSNLNTERLKRITTIVNACIVTSVFLPHGPEVFHITPLWDLRKCVKLELYLSGSATTYNVRTLHWNLGSSPPCSVSNPDSCQHIWKAYAMVGNLSHSLSYFHLLVLIFHLLFSFVLVG